jgi:hypothetical protein
MTLRYKKLAGIGLALASALTLSGCYDDGYGYGGASVGYGSGGYYGYDDYAYGYPGYYGWYDGFYYPGSGYWLYDRGGKRHRWNDQQRRHWEGRREAWRNRDHSQDRAGNWQGRPRDGSWQGRPRDGNWQNRAERGSRNDGQRVESRGWRGRDDGARAAPPASPSGDRGFRARAMRDRND